MSSVTNVDGTPFTPAPTARAGGNVIPLLSPQGCREARRRLGWSQQFLASEAGLSISTIINFELGIHQLRPKNRGLISAVFEAVGCSVVGDRAILRPLRVAE
jgi:predicted transcriptional regulator